MKKTRSNSMELPVLKGRHLSCLLLTGWLALVAGSSDAAGEPAPAAKPSTQTEAIRGDFVARLMAVESGSGAAFLAHLGKCYLPVWNRLHDEGRVHTVSVFELSPYDSVKVDPTTQEFLVLVELDLRATQGDLIEAEKAGSCPDGQDIPTVSVLRSALMSCTPNSCHGTPEPTYQDAATGIDFLIEFIGVEDTTEALAKYREIMSEYGGPANGILVEREMLHCFVAFEAVGILTETPGSVPWNQLHISDDWDEDGEVDWDSVYRELFRSEFSRDSDSVWAELPPTDKTRADYHGRLVSKLCVR